MATVYFTSIRVGGGSSRRNREAIEHTLLLSVQDNQEVERRILLETEITERQQIAVAFLQQPTLTALRKVHDELKASQEYRLLIAAKAARSRLRQMRRATERHQDRTQRRLERKREEAIEAAGQRQLKREKQQRKRAREERRLQRQHQRQIEGRDESGSDHGGSSTQSSSSSTASNDTTSESSNRMRTFSTSSTSSSDSGADTSETSFEDSGSSSDESTSSSDSSSGNSSTSSALFRRDRRLKRREARQQQVKGPRPRELQAVSIAARERAYEYEEDEGVVSMEDSTKRSFPHMIQLSSQEAVSVFKLLWSDVEAQVALAVEQRRRRREEEMLKAQLERARYSGTSLHPSPIATSPNTPTLASPGVSTTTTHTTTTSSTYDQNQRVKLLELKMKGRWGGDHNVHTTTTTTKTTNTSPSFLTTTNNEAPSSPTNIVQQQQQYSLRSQISSIEAMLASLHRADATTVGTSCSAELLMAKRRIAKGPSHTTLRRELITGLRSTGGGGGMMMSASSLAHSHQKPSAASATAAIASDVLTGGGGGIGGGHHTKLRLDTLKAIRRRVMDEIKVDMEQQAHPSATGTYPSDLHESGKCTYAADTSPRSPNGHPHHFDSVGIVSDILKAKEEEHRMMVVMLAEQSPSRNNRSTTPNAITTSMGKRRASASSSTPGGGGMRTSSSRSLTSASGFGAGVALLQALERAVPRDNFATLSKQLSESVYTLYKIWGAYYRDVRSQENENLSQCARDAAEASSPQKNLWYKGWGDRRVEEAARVATQAALDNTTATSALFTRLLCRLLSFDDPLAAVVASSSRPHQTDDINNSPSASSRDTRYVFYQKSAHNTTTTTLSYEHEVGSSGGGRGEVAEELGVTILHEASQVMTEYPLLTELSILPFNSPKSSPVTTSMASKMVWKGSDDHAVATTEEPTYCVQLLDVEVSAACSYHTFHSILKTLASVLYPERSPIVASQLLAATLVRRSHGALI